MWQSMAEFKPDWLSLREAADGLARSSRLTRLVSERVRSDTTLHVLDLATGTGANPRFLAEHLPRQQDWTLVDRDPVLLAELPALMRSWGAGQGLRVASAIRNRPARCLMEFFSSCRANYFR